MIDGIFLASASALWFGILTAISPCPLATNIAAVSYISRDIEKPVRVALSGVFYTAGRMLSYTVLGSLIVAGFLAVFNVANFLQQRMNQALGILLLLAGLVLLEVISLPSISSDFNQRASKKLADMGLIGSFLLGALFALSFCPISAALFFGSLVPLAIKFNSHALLPGVFGVGTALPVLIFAIAFAYGSRAIGAAFNKISVMEKFVRRVTGIIFIGVGIYYLYLYVLKPML